MTKNNRTVKSADRVLYILDELSKNTNGLTFTEMNEKLEFPKSSLNQLLSTLSDSNMIKYNSQTNKYSFGSRLWELAMTYTNNLQIDEVARPYLEKLRDEYNETVQMGILEGKDIVYIEKLNSTNPIQLTSQIGSRLPAYATGLGKAILAGTSKEQVINVYPDFKFEIYTDHTIINRDNLLEELEEIRRSGFSKDLGEYSEGIMCMAVPILGFGNKPVAAISFSLLGNQNIKNKENILVDGLKKCSKEISKALGATDFSTWRNSK